MRACLTAAHKRAKAKGAKPSPLTYELRHRKHGEKHIELYLRGERIASWVSYRPLPEVEQTLAKMQQRFRPEHEFSWEERQHSIFNSLFDTHGEAAHADL